MPDVFRGRKGTSIVKMFDAEGDPTDSYDVMKGISYASSDPTALQIVDEDAEPKDAEIEALAVGSDIMLTCQFDGDPGDGERPITLQAGPFNILEPPPGEAVAATFEVVWEPVITP